MANEEAVYKIVRFYAPITLGEAEERALGKVVHNAVAKNDPQIIIRFFQARNLFDMSADRPWSAQQQPRRKCQAWLEVDIEPLFQF